MFRREIVLSLLLSTLACTTQEIAGQTPAGSTTLVLLTRGGCVNTDTMRARLEDALKAMGSALK